MRVVTMRVAAVALAAWGLYFTWEMLQARFFASMWNLPVQAATLWCAGAAAWDVVIQAVAYSGAAIAAGHRSWALRRSGLVVPLVVYLLIGLTVTVVIERWAVRTGHWRYAPSMPLIAGIGLTPLLQWTIIPLVVLAVARLGLTQQVRIEVPDLLRSLRWDRHQRNAIRFVKVLLVAKAAR